MSPCCSLADFLHRIVPRSPRFAFAEDFERHALANVALRFAVFDQRRHGPTQHVDKARGHGQAVDVDVLLGRFLEQVANGRDAVVLEWRRPSQRAADRSHRKPCRRGGLRRNPTALTTDELMSDQRQRDKRQILAINGHRDTLAGRSGCAWRRLPSTSHGFGGCTARHSLTNTTCQLTSEFATGSIPSGENIAPSVTDRRCQRPLAQVIRGDGFELLRGFD